MNALPLNFPEAFRLYWAPLVHTQILVYRFRLLTSHRPDPPLDRTKVLRQMGFEGRRLGPVQMTTDTALGVVKLVVVDKSKQQLLTSFSFTS